MNLNGRLSYEGNVSGSLGAELVADVEANPAGSPSQTLVSIRVGDVIYSIPTGGGGGGTSDYNALNNKPKVNNVTLSGDLTLADLGIQPAISFPGDGSKYLDGNGSFSTPPGAPDYSTSEVNTGQKWIDGKDVYRKVFSTSSAGASGFTIGTIPNLAEVISQLGVFERNNNWYSLDGRTESPNYNYYYCKSNISSTGDVTIVYDGYSMGEFQRITVIVEYTKS